MIVDAFDMSLFVTRPGRRCLLESGKATVFIGARGRWLKRRRRVCLVTGEFDGCPNKNDAR